MAVIIIFSKVLSYICISLLTKKNPVDYHIDDVVFNTVDKVRDLGIIIDTKLTFVEHEPTKSYVVFLAKITKYFFKAFITYVRPILEYSSLVWSPHTICIINSIESVQRHFTIKLHGI